MFLKQIFLGACGLSFGLLASAGVFTVLVSVGLIPRFAGKFHVAKKVFFLKRPWYLALWQEDFSVYLADTEKLENGCLQGSHLELIRL